MTGAGRGRGVGAGVEHAGRGGEGREDGEGGGRGFGGGAGGAGGRAAAGKGGKGSRRGAGGVAHVNLRVEDLSTRRVRVVRVVEVEAELLLDALAVLVLCDLLLLLLGGLGVARTRVPDDRRALVRLDVVLLARLKEDDALRAALLLAPVERAHAHRHVDVGRLRTPTRRGSVRGGHAAAVGQQMDATPTHFEGRGPPRSSPWRVG